MKKLTFILSREDLVSEMPKIPLVVFKLGLAVVVLIQALGYLMEAPLIFNRSGLFPDSLVHLNFPSGFFEFGNFGGAAISSLLIVLAVASLFADLKIQAFWQFLCWSSFFGSGTSHS